MSRNICTIPSFHEVFNDLYFIFSDLYEFSCMEMRFQITGTEKHGFLFERKSNFLDFILICNEIASN